MQSSEGRSFIWRFDRFVEQIQTGFVDFHRGLFTENKKVNSGRHSEVGVKYNKLKTRPVGKKNLNMVFTKFSKKKNFWKKKVS